MKFSELLIAAIRRAEIPLRFEPGAEEAVAAPVIEMLKIWISAHLPDDACGDFEYGRKALLETLLAELDDARELPS